MRLILRNVIPREVEQIFKAFDKSKLKPVKVTVRGKHGTHQAIRYKRVDSDPEGGDKDSGSNDSVSSKVDTVKDTRSPKEIVDDYYAAQQQENAPWPRNFPKVSAMTSGANLKKHPDYKAAKAGNSVAAFNVIKSVIKKNKIDKLGKLYPNAKIVPVHAEEAAGRNKLPVQFAKGISYITGQQVELGITQDNRVHHTGADAAWRFRNRAVFYGEVQKGPEYILVDDFVTAGGTISELRQYIEGKGGKVVAVASLANAHSAQTGNSGTLALLPETLDALDEKFGYNNVHEFLQEYGIYNGNPAALTNSEARWLLTFGSLDAARERIAKSGSGGKRGGVRSPREGKRLDLDDNREIHKGIHGGNPEVLTSRRRRVRFYLRRPKGMEGAEWQDLMRCTGANFTGNEPLSRTR